MGGVLFICWDLADTAHEHGSCRLQLVWSWATSTC
jgi:hypothetical protein